MTRREKTWGGLSVMRGGKHMLCAVAFGCALVASAGAAPSEETTTLPPIMRESDIEEHLGSVLDRSLVFTDSAGRPVRLGDYLGDKPIVLALAYYRCPMLCGLVLRGLVQGLDRLPFAPGNEYRALTISFDPNDRPDEAAVKRSATVSALTQHPGPIDWSFLVGDTMAIRSLADTLGFRFAYDARTQQYAHPAAVFVLTPEGRISRYLYGTEYSPRDLRLAIVEAGAGKVGSIVDRVLLTCYRFDPASRRFGPFIRGFMRVGAIFIFLVVGTLVAVLFAGERRRRVGWGRAS